MLYFKGGLFLALGGLAVAMALRGIPTGNLPR